VHQDKLTNLSVQGVPVIDTQQIKTQARVTNRATLVLGGILQTKTEDKLRGIPGLSKLPILGAIFRHRIKEQSEQMLLIFITPSIVN
jgi:type IV pilus assembly protein PilQ